MCIFLPASLRPPSYPFPILQVRVRRTTTQPAFDFAYTDPKKDYDVSYHMQNSGGVEMGITKVDLVLLTPH